MSQEGSVSGSKAQSGNDTSEETSPPKPMSYLQEYMAARQRGDTSKFDIMDKPKSVFGYPVVPNGNVITIRERNEENEIIDVQYVQTKFGLVRFDIVGGERVLVANTPVLTEADTTGLDLSEAVEVPANTGCGTPKEIMLDVKSLITRLEEISSDESQMRPKHTIAVLDDNHSQGNAWKYSSEKESNLLLPEADWPPLPKSDSEESRPSLARKKSFRKNSLQQAAEKLPSPPSKMHPQSHGSVQEYTQSHQSPHFALDRSDEECSDVDVESLHSQDTNTSVSYLSQMSCHSAGQVKHNRSPRKQTILEQQATYYNQPSIGSHRMHSTLSPVKQPYHFQAPPVMQQYNAQPPQGIYELYTMPLVGQQFYLVPIQEGGPPQIQNQPLQETQQFPVPQVQTNLPHWQPQAMQIQQQHELQAPRQEFVQIVSPQHLSPEQRPHRRGSIDTQNQTSLPHYQLYAVPPPVQNIQQPDAIAQPQEFVHVSPHHLSPEQKPQKHFQAYALPPPIQNIQQHSMIAQPQEFVHVSPHHLSPEQKPQKHFQAYALPPPIQNIQQHSIIAQPQEFVHVSPHHLSPEQKPQKHFQAYALPPPIQNIQQHSMIAQPQEFVHVSPHHLSPEQKPQKHFQAYALPPPIQNIQQHSMMAQPQEFVHVSPHHLSPEQKPQKHFQAYALPPPIQNIQQHSMIAQPQEFVHVSPHHLPPPEQKPGIHHQYYTLLPPIQNIQQHDVRAQRQQFGQTHSQHRSPEQKPRKLHRTRKGSSKKRNTSTSQISEVRHQEENLQSVERSPKQRQGKRKTGNETTQLAREKDKFIPPRLPEKGKSQTLPKAIKHAQQHDEQAQRQKCQQVRTQHSSLEQPPRSHDQARKISPDKPNKSTPPKGEASRQEEKLSPAERHSKQIQENKNLPKKSTPPRGEDRQQEEKLSPADRQSKPIAGNGNIPKKSTPPKGEARCQGEKLSPADRRSKPIQGNENIPKKSTPPKGEARHQGEKLSPGDRRSKPIQGNGNIPKKSTPPKGEDRHQGEKLSPADRRSKPIQGNENIPKKSTPPKGEARHQGEKLSSADRRSKPIQGNENIPKKSTPPKGEDRHQEENLSPADRQTKPIQGNENIPKKSTPPNGEARHQEEKLSAADRQSKPIQSNENITETSTPPKGEARHQGENLLPADRQTKPIQSNENIPKTSTPPKGEARHQEEKLSPADRQTKPIEGNENIPKRSSPPKGEDRHQEEKLSPAANRSKLIEGNENIPKKSTPPKGEDRHQEEKLSPAANRSKLIEGNENITKKSTPPKGEARNQEEKLSPADRQSKPIQGNENIPKKSTPPKGDDRHQEEKLSPADSRSKPIDGNENIPKKSSPPKIEDRHQEEKLSPAASRSKAIQGNENITKKSTPPKGEDRHQEEKLSPAASRSKLIEGNENIMKKSSPPKGEARNQEEKLSPADRQSKPIQGNEKITKKSTPPKGEDRHQEEKLSPASSRSKPIEGNESILKKSSPPKEEARHQEEKLSPATRQSKPIQGNENITKKSTPPKEEAKHQEENPSAAASRSKPIQGNENIPKKSTPPKEEARHQEENPSPASSRSKPIQGNENITKKSTPPKEEARRQEENLSADERHSKMIQGNENIQSADQFHERYESHTQTQDRHEIHALPRPMQVQSQHRSPEQKLAGLDQSRRRSSDEPSSPQKAERKKMSEGESPTQRQRDGNWAPQTQPLQETQRVQTKSSHDKHQSQNLSPVSGQEKPQFQTPMSPEKNPFCIQPFQYMYTSQTQSIQGKQPFRSDSFREKHQFQTQAEQDKQHQTQTSLEANEVETRKGQEDGRAETRPLQDTVKFQSQAFQIKHTVEMTSPKETNQIKFFYEESQIQTEPLTVEEPKWYTQPLQYKQQYELLAQRQEYKKQQKEHTSPDLGQRTLGNNNNNNNTLKCSPDKQRIERSPRAEEEQRFEKLLSDERDSMQKESTKEANVNKAPETTPQDVRERLQKQLEQIQLEVQMQQRWQRQNKPRYDGSRRVGPRERLHSPHQGRQPAVNASVPRLPVPQRTDSPSLSRRNSNSSTRESDKDEAPPYVWPGNREEQRPPLPFHQPRETRPQTRHQFKERRSSDPLLNAPTYVQPMGSWDESFQLPMPRKKTGKRSWAPETDWDATICIDDSTDDRQSQTPCVEIESSGGISSIDPNTTRRASRNPFDVAYRSSHDPAQQSDEESQSTQSVDYSQSEIASTTSYWSEASANLRTHLSRRTQHSEEIESSVSQLGHSTWETNFHGIKQKESARGKQDPLETGYSGFYKQEESLEEIPSQRAISTRLASPVLGRQEAHKQWPEANTKSFKGHEPRQTLQQGNASRKSTSPVEFWSIPTCPSCHQNFRWPHLLSCLHSFCFRCIVEFSISDREKIKCPLCSWLTIVSVRGAFDLNLDIDMCSKIFRSVNPFLCTLCPGPGNGVAGCVQCMHFLCYECESQHAMSQCSGSNALEPVAKFKWNQGELSEMCPNHPTSVGDRYCLDCKTMICILCVRYGKQHVQHTFVKEVDHSKKRIQNITVDVDRMRDHVRRQMQPMILKKQDIESKARACKRNIHLFSNDVIEVANKKRSESRVLLDKVHEDVISGIKRLEDLTTQFSNEYKTFAEFTERYLKDVTPTILMPMASKIKSRYEALQQKYEEIQRLEGYLKADLLFSPEFPAVNDTITQSYNLEVSESLSDLFNKETDMSRLLRQNMAEVLSKNSFDINSQIKDEFAERENGGSMTNNSPVNVIEEIQPEQDFSRQGTLSILSFGEKGNGEYSFGEPSGVVYLLNGSLAVCDTANHRIVIYDENYTYERTIGQPPVTKSKPEDNVRQDRYHKSPGCLYFPYRLAQCPQSGNIVVIERPPSRAIQIFDVDGSFIHRFGNDVLQHPRGVTVDENGVIVVVEGKTMKLMLFTQKGSLAQLFHLCVHLEFPNDIAAKNGSIYISDNRKHCVHIFDYNGQPRGTIGNESVTYYPIGVSLNFMDKLVVTDNHNTFNISVFDRDGNYQYGYKSRVKHANCYNVAVHPTRCELAVTSRDYLVIIFDYTPPGQLCT